MVAALVQGFRPVRATIEPDDARQTLGGIYYAAHDQPAKDDEPYLIPPERWPALEDEMTTILAGPVATAFLTGTAPALQFGWARDYEQARELAERRGVHRHETGAFLAFIRIRAEYLVEIQWTAIKRVAAALEERKTLTRDEALALIREAEEAPCPANPSPV
jgi:hypothetical protein